VHHYIIILDYGRGIESKESISESKKAVIEEILGPEDKIRRKTQAMIPRKYR
jgi:hypothetical protein